MTWNDPITWVPFVPLTAAQLNEQVRDNFKALGDPWTSYSPAWTAVTTDPTLGNGALSGSYLQVGKLVMFKLRLTFGSTTTTGSGNYIFSLPADANGTQGSPVGNATITNGAVRLGQANLNGTSAIYVVRTANDTLISSAGAGAAWATGHTVDVVGTYEAL